MTHLFNFEHSIVKFHCEVNHFHKMAQLVCGRLELVLDDMKNMFTHICKQLNKFMKTKIVDIKERSKVN